MAGRPNTALSEISSAISEDGNASRPTSGVANLPSLPNPSTSQHGYAHLRGIINRSQRSNPATDSNAGSSRPQSPASQASRTHVPSLTAQGFFKPMSSQKLQAQRLRRSLGGKPVQPPAPIVDDEDDEADARSLASSRQGPFHAMPRSHRHIPSIATDYTQSEAPETVDNQFPDFASQTDGETQLVNATLSPRDSHPQHPPARLNISSAQKTTDQAQKSPMSFRSGLSLASKHRLDSGHQPLPSSARSSHLPAVSDARVASRSALGKNYEYFEGNTVFWWGGRLQNARDRPINIATAVILIIPAVFFFIYS